MLCGNKISSRVKKSEPLTTCRKKLCGRTIFFDSVQERCRLGLAQLYLKVSPYEDNRYLELMTSNLLALILLSISNLALRSGEITSPRLSSLFRFFVIPDSFLRVSVVFLQNCVRVLLLLRLLGHFLFDSILTVGGYLCSVCSVTLCSFLLVRIASCLLAQVF